MECRACDLQPDFRWKKGGRLLLAALFLILAARQAVAQTDDTSNVNPRHAQLALVARTDRDSVVLRWAPSTPGGWSTANRIGYIVERVRVGAEGAFDPRSYERLTPAPMRPWTLEEWRRLAQRENKFAAISAQLLYGKSFVPRAADTARFNALQAAADEFANRHSFALFAADNDAVAAEGLALRLVDRNARAGEKYIYRVFLAARDTSYSVDTAYAVVDVTPFEQAPPPPDLVAEGSENRIILRWRETPVSGFSGYHVYRSEDRGRTWRQLTTTPIVIVTPEGALERAQPRYDDSTIVNYRAYRYQVRGVTPFADLSMPAEIESYGRDVTPPPMPLVEEPMQVGRNRLRITWTMPSTPGDLAGFLIAKSSNSMTGFRSLFEKPLPKGAREYIDDSASAGEPYYIIAAVDTSGNVAPSLVAYGLVIDSLPPARPTGLTGTIDTNGIVRLVWTLGLEADIIGYRVLWANDTTHEFTQRTPEILKDTAFTDTINVQTLTPYVYYQVAAVDTRHNHSAPSITLALRRPDRIPPQPSVFTDVFVTDSSVVLRWARSRSEDLAAQVLSRRVGSDAEWRELARMDQRTESYTDRDVEQGVMYQYRIHTLDSAGHTSDGVLPVQGRPYDTGRRPGVRDLRATYNADGTVTLEWGYGVGLAERHWFVIYREFGAEGMRQYRSVESGDRAFKDALLVGSGPYKYAVRVMTERGGESPLSNVATVRVP